MTTFFSQQKQQINQIKSNLLKIKTMMKCIKIVVNEYKLNGNLKDRPIDKLMQTKTNK